ncbi:tumor necrosis factor alpha-induced protein 2 [Microcaecilia unicolor]|uniref:Tumor necrosis factor alpha-induced protein 2 n=1 Tax=Microcaecilia unicolor TaxID=1415580 RepID=A0A6P7Z1H5_9AMPH|nr:tumor necrosis factor alpha-induced protein 2 [Microcaecilia unicolor]
MPDPQIHLEQASPRPENAVCTGAKERRKGSTMFGDTSENSPNPGENEASLSNTAADQSRKVAQTKKAQLPDSKKTGKQKKRRGLGTKFMRLFACVGKRSVSPSERENTSIQPVVTVAQIREHINHSRLLSASKDLIDLEHKVYSKTYGKSESEAKKDQTELEELYQLLEKDVSRIVGESIANYNPDLLQQAVEAMTEQENEDQKYLPEKVPSMVNNARPRKWKTIWQDAVKCSVQERMTKNGECSSNNLSVIAQLLLHLGKTFREDLTHVVTHLRQHYTKDYDVCNTYAEFYFEIFCGHLRTFTEFELGDRDTYLILSWVESIYPNEILSHFSLETGVDVDKLGNLLPSPSIRELEYDYIISEETRVQEWMNKSLEVEVKKWKEEREPEKLNDCYHSELPIDILRIIYSAKEQAERLSGDMSRLLMQRLLPMLSDLLKSYKESFEEFKEKHSQHNYFESVIMMNINSCQTFRENIEKLQKPICNDCLSALKEIEISGSEVLLEDLFQNLKLYFRQFSSKNGLCSYKTMQDIIKTTQNRLSQLTMLKETCYKDIVERIHFHLVKEYIVRLMKKKVSKKIPDEQQSMANQILKNAQLIEDCCSSHGSKAVWLNPVIPTMAEIIKLQDVSSIQIEVASLARKYPDINKKHVASILYIKGNLTNAEVRVIQDILDHSERQTDPFPQLFSYVN